MRRGGSIEARLPRRALSERLALAILLVLALSGCSEQVESQPQDVGAAAGVRSVDVDGTAYTPTPDEWERIESLDANALKSEQAERQSAPPADVAAALADAQAANPDVIAWLVVPGTNVSLPVACRSDDDAYYAVHDASGAFSPLGAAYIESASSSGFDDPVTVVYGHAFFDAQVMFTQLHLFGDEGFFDTHDEFSLHLPGRVLTYRVASAYVMSDVRIPSLFDPGDPAQVQAYFNVAVDPGVSGALSRDEPAPDALAGGRVVQLSTCLVPYDPARRFVVTGVLVGEEEVQVLR